MLQRTQPAVQLGQVPGVRGLCQLCCSVHTATTLGDRAVAFVEHICHTKKLMGSVLESRAVPQRRGEGRRILCSTFGYKGLEREWGFKNSQRD